MRTLRSRILIPSAFCGVLFLLITSCGGAQPDVRDVAASGPVFDLGANDRTQQPVQVDPLAGSGYTIEPLLTVGDEIPLLQGNYPAVNLNKKLSYNYPGIPDGIGVAKHGEHYWVFTNHEISPGSFSKYSDTISGTINGARVSLLLFDKNWGVEGGRNAIERVYDGATEIGSITVNTSTKTATQTGTVFNRFCSAGLTEIYGEPLYFTGEETSNGRAFTVDTTGNARLIRDLVKVAYENIIPISKWADQTVAVADDDTSPGGNAPNGAFLISYVGDRSQGNYGYNAGTSYVGRVLVAGSPVSSSAGLVQGTDYTVQWVAVPRTYDFDGAGPNPAVDLYNNSSNFYKWANTVAGATGFMRPEDGHENPAVPGQIHFVTTGRLGSYEQFGRVWQLTFGATPTADATLRGIATGSTSTFMNPDNVVADTFGKLWVQEDPSSTQGLMLAAGRLSSVWRSNLGSPTLTRVFEVNQNRPPFSTMPIATFAADPWEASGIVQVGEVNGDAAVIFDTQAHGFPAPGYVEGGQLMLAYPSEGGWPANGGANN